MKKGKYVFLFIIVLFALCLFGCDKENDEGKESTTTSMDKIEEWILETVKPNIAASITLPTTCPDYEGSVITWLSDDESYITNDGEIVDRDNNNMEIGFTYIIQYEGSAKSNEFIFNLCYMSLEKVKERFEAQLPTIIIDDIEFVTSYGSMITVSWYSSNQEVFTNDGEYIKPNKDTVITIYYSISDGTTTLDYSKEITARGKTSLDFFNEANDWIKNEFLCDRYITEDLVFPTEYEDTDITFSWSSDDENIISNTGKITKTLYDRYVKLNAKITYGSSYFTYSFECIVAAKDTTNMTKEEMMAEIVSNIAVTEYKKLEFLLYGNINQSYGFLYFFNNSSSVITEKIVTEGADNRPGITNNVQYVTVHDTANNSTSATAQMHGNYVFNGGGGTSWHYSVGDDGIYHQIPDTETAYHAGDGSRIFELVDSGIKATAVCPSITLDGSYLCINGVKSSVQVEGGETTYLKEEYDTDDINSLGIICEIGENGNYYLGKTYYNTTYKRIANYGGNRNSIGIESCVNSGSDYATTIRILAKLVAELCMDNNLDVSRVKGHHYFSGKPCPNAMLTANYWYEFLNYVSLEKFARENLSEYTFTWKSNSSTLNDSGKISLSAKAGDKLSYSVKITETATSVVKYEKSFETLLK